MRRYLGVVGISILLALGLAACSSGHKKTSKLDPFAGKGSPYYKGKGAIPEGGGRYHVGKPYQVAGKWFTPKEQPGYDKKGVASWYGEAFHARKTANGEWFDMNDLTAAHPTLPIPSYAKVTNLENNKQIVVRINDRGPFVGTRLIDLSKASSKELGFKQQGKANVRVQWIGNAPLNDKSYAHLQMMNKLADRGASMRQLASAADDLSAAKVQVAGLKPRTTDITEQPPVQQASAEQAASQQSLYQQASTPAVDNRSGGFVVQVATFRDLENAQGAADSVAAFGPTRLLETNSDSGTFYRLQVGPIFDKPEATNALYAVRDNGFPEARLARIVIQQVSSR
ncbi:MAG: septal ring lytic transglycosylase RlpA family protein [Proteobacteria bacterium]|nr:septal ring lytic transglycosylase RlpA family protein [Pseudomonadota bacterium]